MNVTSEKKKGGGEIITFHDFVVQYKEIKWLNNNEKKKKRKISHKGWPQYLKKEEQKLGMIDFTYT